MKLCRVLSLVWAAAVVLVCQPARADFTPVAGFDEHLFPSYIIATASLRPEKSEIPPTRLGDPQGLLGIKVVAPKDNATVVVTVECSDFFEPSIFSGQLPTEGETYFVTPKIKYRYDRLAQCEQTTPITVTFRVKFGSETTAEEQTLGCTMRSINDCPFAFQNGEETVDIGYTFAAYVNEQHPFVDKLLREALDIGIVNSFSGYQSGDEADVIRQAYALWDLLVARDIRYSSITVTAVHADSVACQHVRLIEDSINNSQANCVDGSVLWVSLMRKIGINAFLVLEETHCYAGFYTDRAREKCMGIETTLLGETMATSDLTIPEEFDAAVPEDQRNDASFASFVAAIQIATTKLGELAEDKEGSERKEAAPQIIDIAAARRTGIMPIAFQNKEGFSWRDNTAAETDAKPASKKPSSSSGSASDSDSDESTTTSTGGSNVEVIDVADDEEEDE